MVIEDIPKDLLAKIKINAIQDYNKNFMDLSSNLGFSNVANAARVFESEYVNAIKKQAES